MNLSPPLKFQNIPVRDISSHYTHYKTLRRCSNSNNRLNGIILDDDNKPCLICTAQLLLGCLVVLCQPCLLRIGSKMSRRKQIDKSHVQTDTASLYKFEHLVSENGGFIPKSATLVKRIISSHCVVTYCYYCTVHRLDIGSIKLLFLSYFKDQQITCNRI